MCEFKILYSCEIKSKIFCNITLLYHHVPPQMPFWRGWETALATFGSGLSSLVSLVIPVFDTLVIIVTDGSYELQKKVAHSMSDRFDRLLSWITEENYWHMTPYLWSLWQTSKTFVCKKWLLSSSKIYANHFQQYLLFQHDLFQASLKYTKKYFLALRIFMALSAIFF